jgi:PhnB protein
MNFYKECSCGELILQTIGESPMADTMPTQMRESTLHSTLTNGAVVILVSDMVSDKGVIKENSVSLMRNWSSEEEIRN